MEAYGWPAGQTNPEQDNVGLFVWKGEEKRGLLAIRSHSQPPSSRDHAYSYVGQYLKLLSLSMAVFSTMGVYGIYYLDNVEYVSLRM